MMIFKEFKLFFYLCLMLRFMMLLNSKHFLSSKNIFEVFCINNEDKLQKKDIQTRISGLVQCNICIEKIM
jgi:hypothetical protein